MMKIKRILRQHWYLAILVLMLVVGWAKFLILHEQSSFLDVVDVKARTDRTNWMDDYDPAIGLREVELGKLSEEVKCYWEHRAYQLDDTETQILEDSELKLKERVTYYDFCLEVQNDTRETFSGLNLRFDADI